LEKKNFLLELKIENIKIRMKVFSSKFLNDQSKTDNLSSKLKELIETAIRKPTREDEMRISGLDDFIYDFNWRKSYLF